MHLKDHYKILELLPSASLQEIKFAYRKLAQQYHPDKNNDDPYAVAHFNEIKEAYETLTNPTKKNDYLQKRWYNKTTGNTNVQQVVTPVAILKQALEFEQYTATLDVFRMDKESLAVFMEKLLSDENIDILLQFKEPDINHQTIITLLKPVRLLHTEQAIIVINKLSKLAAGDEQTLSLINSNLQQMKRKEQWEKYKWIVVLLVTIGICVLIKFSAGG